MHIALHHDALIPPTSYGGTERVILWLARALLRLGHKVTLAARKGSQLPGATSLALPRESSNPWEELLPSSVDIIHYWAPPASPPRKPCVVTIGGIGKPGETFHPNSVFVSRSHAENHGSEHFVHNGIDPDDYQIGRKTDSLAFLAKASWKVKNLQGAIAVARASGMPLEVLGSRNWPLGLHRLSSMVGLTHYHGMVGDREKREVLSHARGLLFPVRWPEPFGLAITEALASGCAVFGTPYGSLPEIVTPEIGVLSSDGKVLADAIRDHFRHDRFPAERCRSRVLEGFTHLDMARSYLRYYSSVLEHGHLGVPASQPRTREGLIAERLLEWRNP